MFKTTKQSRRANQKTSTKSKPAAVRQRHTSSPAERARTSTSYEAVAKAARDGDRECIKRIEADHHLETIEQIAMKSLPPSHAFIVAVKELRKESKRDDWYIPPLDKLNEAIALFYALPESEKLQALNGWKPDPNRKTTAAFESEIAGGGLVNRHLIVSGDGNGACAQVRFTIGHDWNNGFLIHEGQTKAEALGELDRIRRFIEKHFDAMVRGDHPEGKIDEKTRTAQPQNDVPSQQAEFFPELCEDWLPAGWNEHEPADGFTVRAGDIHSREELPWVCRIVVNPSFSQENQRKIANLMGRAPDLWRMLREVARDALQDDIESIDDFAAAWKLLWDTAGHRPFEVAQEMPEKELSVTCNSKIIEQLKLSTKTAA